MSYSNPSNSHSIPLATAVEMTSLYRAQKENILDAEYRNENVLAICETFNRQAFDDLLAEPDCNALRVYYGMDEDLKVHAIIVGVDETGNDILPSQLTETSEEDKIVEEGQRCPDFCPPPSPLNGGE